MTRLVVWLAEHPMSAVFLALALLGSTSWWIAYAFSEREPRSERPLIAESGVAPSVLPKPTEFPSLVQVDHAHRALHALSRACTRPPARRDPGSVRQALRVIEDFASNHPDAGFTIDDESGTTLALLIVVRNELVVCDPTLIPRIDALIPPQYRA